MSPRTRRTLIFARRHWPSAIGAIALASLLLSPVDSLLALSWPHALILLTLAAAVGTLGWRLVGKRAERDEVPLLDEVEFGALLVVASYLVIQPAGGFQSTLYPLVYLVVAFQAAFFQLRVAVGLTLFAILVDVLVFAGAGGSSSQATTLSVHATFLALFALLSRLVTGLKLQAVDLEKKKSLAAFREQHEARVRLTRMQGGEWKRAIDDDEWIDAAVVEVSRAVENALEVVQLALSTHSVAVFLFDQEEPMIKLYEARAEGAELRVDTFDAREGLMGAALRRGLPMRLRGVLRGINWYVGAPDVKSVLFVPLIDRRTRNREGSEGGEARGMIVADRLEAKEFTEEDERLVVAISREVLRAIETERVMRQIRKAQDDTERLFASIDALNRINKESEVLPAAMAAVRKLTERRPLDFIALTSTWIDPSTGTRKHRIEQSWSNGITFELADGHEFDDNVLHVSNVVRDSDTLVIKDPKLVEKVHPFREGAPLRGLQILKIMPMDGTGGDGREVLGTLVCGARSRQHLGREVTSSLEALAKQVAQALQRARLFDANTKLATTDGLTGLYNHRVFQARFKEQLENAKRHDRKLSLIITDIDHFKSVNDAYGHATGDQVLKGVAKIIQGCARNTDVVARYGGEEFALLLPETDSGGAKVIAERIREMVKAHVFQTELGPLQCTLSLGIATFPRIGEGELFEVADQCLYHCKRTGRDRTTSSEDLEREASEGEAARAGEGAIS